MASHQFNWQSFMIRLAFALVLVFLTYNPSGYSFFHWANQTLFSDSGRFTPPFAMAAVILLIGWTVYIKATLSSLGPFGLALSAIFFGIIIWWFIDIGLVSLKNYAIMTYLGLFILAAVLATGMSWSHVRRRISGQTDVDEIED
jgi:hypothetical protein